MSADEERAEQEHDQRHPGGQPGVLDEAVCIVPSAGISPSSPSSSRTSSMRRVGRRQDQVGVSRASSATGVPADAYGVEQGGRAPRWNAASSPASTAALDLAVERVELGRAGPRGARAGPPRGSGRSCLPLLLRPTRPRWSSGAAVAAARCPAPGGAAAFSAASSDSTSDWELIASSSRAMSSPLRWGRWRRRGHRRRSARRSRRPGPASGRSCPRRAGRPCRRRPSPRRSRRRPR